MRIETGRLIIRPLRPEHVPEIQAAKEEVWGELQTWMSWAYDDQKPQSAMEAFAAGLHPEKPFDVAACFARDNGKFAVMGGIMDDGDGVFATGYWCALSQRGKGYATEATNAAIRYAFDRLGARAVNINYYEGNDASRRVIEKLGFTFVRTDKGGHLRCSDGTPLDVHRFTMIDPSVLPPLDWRLVEGAE
jgi:ribosomal-protein-alanine N-acetyltransferase